ncbi:ROK family protein [Bombilactobacillus thymidiniphilus]|uniref:ROK family protein n=1 Tax=Bombilactobacillus thymidiniphilus TaxID=2923363 RepID=A0ABY4PD92_9LACO|nr:ROK family protein [Bombilactobacillus thymidiniphilus]UQS83690.1 ROK family protein [Bombilactobacillus thymidiniphilus]
MSKQFLCIDVGGTNIKYALLDRKGQVVSQDKCATPLTGLADFLTVVQDIVDGYTGAYQGLAFSVPGRVDHENERIHGGGLLTFLDQQILPDLIQVADDIPITVENDAKAAVQAEMWLGNLQDVTNGAAVVLGSGVGSGIVLNHQLLTGSHFQAGEVSFMLQDQALDINSFSGAHGSAVGMIKKIAKALQLPDLTDGEAVFTAIQQHNAKATAIFQEFCHDVAVLINNMQAVLDLERYVIGGGISAQPIVAQTIKIEYQKLREKLPILATTLTQPEIVTGKFQNDANLCGALYHFLQVNTALN